MDWMKLDVIFVGIHTFNTYDIAFFYFISQDGLENLRKGKRR